MSIKETGPLFFGIAVLAAGTGLGYLMAAFPEGLDPRWPLGVALLVPAVMALAGLHMIGTGLGLTRFAHSPGV